MTTTARTRIVRRLRIHPAGNIFGTTQLGGNSCNAAGTVWELSPVQGGGWNYSVLQVMLGADDYPDAGVVLDDQGNLYFAEGGGNVFDAQRRKTIRSKSFINFPVRARRTTTIQSLSTKPAISTGPARAVAGWDITERWKNCRPTAKAVGRTPICTPLRIVLQRRAISP